MKSQRLNLMANTLKLIREIKKFIEYAVNRIKAAKLLIDVAAFLISSISFTREFKFYEKLLLIKFPACLFR